eukprot:649684-Pleurochrysis_carterae.AAC.1
MPKVGDRLLFKGHALYMWVVRKNNVIGCVFYKATAPWQAFEADGVCERGRGSSRARSGRMA